jgi:hypothetical protein
MFSGRFGMVLFQILNSFVSISVASRLFQESLAVKHAFQFECGGGTL